MIRSHVQVVSAGLAHLLKMPSWSRGSAKVVQFANSPQHRRQGHLAGLGVRGTPRERSHSGRTAPAGGRGGPNWVRENGLRPDLRERSW